MMIISCKSYTCNCKPKSIRVGVLVNVCLVSRTLATLTFIYTTLTFIYIYIIQFSNKNFVLIFIILLE